MLFGLIMPTILTYNCDVRFIVRYGRFYGGAVRVLHRCPAHERTTIFRHRVYWKKVQYVRASLYSETRL